MSERYQSPDLDRAMEPREIMAFSEEVIWPAVDHMRGGNFRDMAQQRKKLRLRRKVTEIEGYLGPERIIIEARASKDALIEPDDGPIQRACEVMIVVEEMHTELKESVIKVLDSERKLDEVESEDAEELADRWWLDEELDWQPWETRTYCFSTDPSRPFFVFHNIEAQDEEEKSPEDRWLWEFTQADRPPMDTELGEQINYREDELEQMLSYREALEIRAALIRSGVPAEILAER